jgi:hypothetical protein
MLNTITFHELRRRSELETGILAICFRAGRRARTTRLPDGAIVKSPTAAERLDAPERPDDLLEIGHGGVPATSHHRQLGLVIGFSPLAGAFLLPTGEVAAVSGADALPFD